MDDARVVAGEERSVDGNFIVVVADGYGDQALEVLGLSRLGLGDVDAAILGDLGALAALTCHSRGWKTPLSALAVTNSTSSPAMSPS